MNKLFISLFTTVFFSVSTLATSSAQATMNTSQENSHLQNVQSDSIKRNERVGDLAQNYHQSPKRDARWYKKSEKRRQYLKGGSDHPDRDKSAHDPQNK